MALYTNVLIWTRRKMTLMNQFIIWIVLFQPSSLRGIRLWKCGWLFIGRLWCHQWIGRLQKYKQFGHYRRLRRFHWARWILNTIIIIEWTNKAQLCGAKLSQQFGVNWKRLKLVVDDKKPCFNCVQLWLC